MKKITLNYWLDVIAFVVFAFLTSTGILMQYSLPERSGRSTVWGLTRHEWGDLHFYIAIALFATLALHIVLHWKWIVNITQGHAGTASGWRLFVGVLALLAVILLAGAPTMSTVESVDTGGHGFGYGARP
jgi:hypothetical protein